MTMDHHARFRATESNELLRFRKAEGRDSVAMWRLKRSREQEAALSPFFYMAVIQRFAHAVLVAERAGDVIGYVIARPNDSGRSVRVIDLVVDATEDALGVTAGLLDRLVRMPAHAGARFVEADLDAHQTVRRLLHIVQAVPLARCERPDPCITEALVDGAVG
jgi:hypothetical protein